jgi:mycothiol synthase
MSADFTLRPYRSDDAGPVVALVNAHALQTTGGRRAVVDAVGNVRLARYVPVASDKVVAVSNDGEVVGYAYLANRDQAIVYEIGGAVHPDYWGRGLGSLLVEWAQARALAYARRAPRGIRAVIQTNLFEAEPAARELFRTHGFQPVREWAHFMLEMQVAPEAPAVSNDLRIRPMDLAHGWDLAGPAMDEAFSDHWGAITLEPGEAAIDDQPAPALDMPEDDSYSNAPGFCFLCLAGETVAGGVLCNAKLVERGDTARIGSVFVRPAYRRRGIGRALLLTAFQAFWRHSVRRIMLDTDAQSFTNAPLFYRALGMRQYRREWLYEKELQPGREVRRLRV